MKRINVYEVGVDPLPVEGSTISIIDSQSSMGMFEKHFQVEGQVEYITDEDREEYGLEDVVFCLDTGHEIKDGCKWLYPHEYLPIISDITFPFQDWKYYQIAVSQGWCKQVAIDDSEDWFTAPDGTQVRWFHTYVTCNGYEHKVTWVKHKKSGSITMVDWDLC